MKSDVHSHHLRRIAAWTLCIVCGWTAEPCRAHADSDAEIEMCLVGGQLRGSWQGALRDLDHALDLDADGDGRLTRAEWNARCDDVEQFVGHHLALLHHGQPLTLAFGEWSLPATFQGRSARLEFTATLPPQVSGIVLEYTALFDGDPWHRGHATLTGSDGARSRAMLSPDRRRWPLPLAAPVPQVIEPRRRVRAWFGYGAAAAAIGLIAFRALSSPRIVRPAAH